jgi:hypothetical protein
MFRRKLIAIGVMSLVMGPLAMGATTPQALSMAQVLSNMKSNAAAMQTATQDWMTIQSDADAYAQFSSYANNKWSGRGPVVTNLQGIQEQCHNTRWDSLTSKLVLGALNDAGDAETETYAIQTLSTQWQSDYAQYMIDSAENHVSQTAFMQTEKQMNSSLQSLDALLTTTGQQLQSAMNPQSSTLEALPFSSWTVGIGNVPNISGTRYTKGRSDGVPIGFYLAQAMPSRLVDICPTGTAVVPMDNIAYGLSGVVQEAVSDEPALQQVLPAMGVSAYSLPNILSLGLGTDSVNYASRVQTLVVLAHDLPAVGAYMEPIDPSLAAVNSNIQKMTQEVVQ